MSQHRDQIASVIQRSVQSVLARGLQDPRLRGLISVTRVVVSPDKREATVHCSVMPEQHARTTMHGIQHATRHIQSQVAQLVRMRRVPQLHFRLDQSLKKQAAVLAAINEARSQDGDVAPDSDRQREDSPR